MRALRMLLDANDCDTDPDRFRAAPMQGLGASTLMSERLVVQRRSHRGAVGVIRAARLLSERHPGARLHPGLIVQHGEDLAAHNWHADGDPPRAEAIWTLQPRVAGKATHPKDLTSGELVAYAHAMLGPVIGQLRDLEPLMFDDLGWTLGGTRGLTHQLVGTGPLCAIGERVLGYEPGTLARLLGQEPQADWVMSHGDAIVGNVVRAGDHFTLIDWECIGPLPAQRDILRLFSYPAKYLPLDAWDDLEEALWEHAKGRLVGWGREGFRRGANWSLVREFVAFPTADPAPIAAKIRARLERA